MSIDRCTGLLDYLEDQPTAYLPEMQQFIYDTYDIEIAACTISSYLGRVKWSRKVVRARAAEQSKPLRIAWQGLQVQ
ncbi:MAG: hypothetical protein M1840_003496 [Geoglossum simile]|nr:MAG: hypothetical protein M1840_003496 [Geoglossum simile]